jgi:small subunit ribosomal protein S2
MIENTKITISIPDKKALLEAGAHFGHQVQRWNPKMKDNIIAVKNNIHIIDLEKTIESFTNAVNFLANNSSTSSVLVVATKKQARKMTEDFAKRAGCFFIDRRWVGGLFTNFDVIKKSLDRLLDLEESFKNGITDRTKYEITIMKKEWERLSTLYRGIKHMRRKPSAVIILDVEYEKSAVKEAKKVGIPIVATVDTNADPSSVDYPIFINDDAIKSIALTFNVLSEALIKNQTNEKINHEFQNFLNFSVKSFNTAAIDNTNGEAKRVLTANVVTTSAQESESKGKSSNRSKTQKAATITNKKGILGKYQAEKTTKKIIND